jgi:glycosyltransferase involved in cell wall biosynthesis
MPTEKVDPRQVAMLVQGDEVYGVGAVEKLYASHWPELSFVALGDGPLVDWLRTNGNRVDVVHGMMRFSAGGRSLATVLRTPSMMARARRDAARIDALLRPRGIRIIHAHWRPQQIMAGFMRRRGYKSVWHIHNNTNPRRLVGIGLKLNHGLARWGADLLMPVSAFIGRNWEGAAVPMAVVHNAAPQFFESANRLPDDPVRCIIAGRLEHVKGHHLAVAAVIRARQSGFDVRLDVFGGPLDDNAYADQLKQQIAAAGCSEAIQFRGFEPAMRRLHQQYHLGLQCRIDPEPCSVWVCESLVDGLPLVASASGGTPELVDDGVTGLLFSPGSADELAHRLVELCQDRERLAGMRQAAFARGQRHCSVPRFLNETLAAYASLVQ